jgi:hypothetical protein
MRLAFVHLSLAVLRQLDDVINVKEQNELNIAQHQLKNFVDKPANIVVVGDESRSENSFYSAK